MEAPTTSLPKIRLVNPGPLGEEKVVKSLLGPDTHVTQTPLEGFAVYRQDPKDVNLGDVRGMLDAAWSDPAKPFLGAYTLIPQEGAQTMVGCVEFDSPADLKKAHPHLEYWNFHNSRPGDKSTPPSEENPNPLNIPWYKYQKLFQDGDTIYITEVVNEDPSKLQRLDENYREEEGYQAMVDEMAQQAAEYRKEEELKQNNTEGQSDTPSTEIKG